jgi:hypothetical protein
VAYIEDIIENDEIVDIKQIVFPLVVVLTQDCDLSQDHDCRCSGTKTTNQSRQILSALVAPAYNCSHFEVGEHLSELKLKMWVVPSGKGGKETTDQRNLRQNKNPRYHYLHFNDAAGIVDSVIDFKHYFSVNVTYLTRIKKEHFAGKLAALYREDVCQRFACILSRIGLPNQS